MLDRTIEKNGKELRYGYTTGSCATAATKAALLMFINQKKQESVLIKTPKGWDLDLLIHDQTYNSQGASCSVIKDSGDDPDVTNGVKVFSRVYPASESGVHFHAGQGVGTVTSPGLSIPVGQAAINPVPRQMIEEVIAEVLAQADDKVGKGWNVEISIPQGVELAKRTFNPKLGIVGGLSVIGTSGIVEPMSEEALKASLKLELSVLKARGLEQIIFVPGNYGKDFADELNLPESALVKTSNYLGFMLDEAERMEIKKILLIGHLGKLVKVAGGIFNTHSNVADGRMEILTAYAGLLGGGRELLTSIMQAKTTDEATDLILKAELPGYFDTLAQAVKKKVTGRVYGNIEIEVIIFSRELGFLGQSQNAETMRDSLCIN